MTPQEQSYRIIALTKGQFAVVDAAKYENIAAYKWHAYPMKGTDKFYAARSVAINGKYIKITMHRQILGLHPNDGKKVDHKNHDPLDNRETNLRTSTTQQNLMNRGMMLRNKCGFKGVMKKGNKFRAYIRHNRKGIHLGYFSTPELAHAAYYAAACRLFGEFACH